MIRRRRSAIYLIVSQVFVLSLYDCQLPSQGDKDHFHIAISKIKQVHSAEREFFLKYHRYGDLNELLSEKLITPDINPEQIEGKKRSGVFIEVKANQGGYKIRASSFASYQLRRVVESTENEKLIVTEVQK